MENRNKYLLLALGIVLNSASPVSFAEQAIDIINPTIDRRSITDNAIDTENIEIGLQYGLISIEDFDSAETIIVRSALHITEDFFFEISFSQATGDKTSFEQLSGGIPLYTDKDREFTHYDIALGWNILPGQVSISDKYRFNSAFYLISGVGSTNFLNDNWFTVTLGAGYRLLLTDSVAWHIDVRDHMFDRETFSIKETTNNIEFSTGISLFF